jgi:ankyrin repeat protein
MSRVLRADDPLAVDVVEAIRGGNVEGLERLLRDNEGLATATIRDESCGDDSVSRTLLQVATDWPGHFPNVAATIAALVEAGAEVDAGNAPGTETPLHWAASSDDIDALDALVAAGADLEAPGAVIAGGTPLDDAVAFAQWQAARRLVEHGARTALWHAAALGLIDRVEAHFAGDPTPALYPWGASGDQTPDGVTVAFWCACHGGQRQTAEYLLERSADLDWIATWDGHTPLDTARREGADDVVAWLRTRGAKTADELAGRGKER